MLMYKSMELIDIYRLALKAVLKQKKRGTQSALADQLKIPRTTMSDFIRGRQAISEGKREQIANELGYKYEEFLALGRRLSNGEDVDFTNKKKEPFPNYEKIMRLPILDRAWAILRAAGEQHGITEYMGSSGADPKPKFARKLMDGEQTEEELYAECYERMRELADQTREALRKMGVDVKE